MTRIRQFLLVVAASLLVGGCGKESSSCQKVTLAICDACDVGDSLEDTTCACLDEGEVDNWRDYFSTKGESEAWCDKTKTLNKEVHLSADDLAECAGALDVMDEYGDDACTYFGYEPASNAPDFGDGDGDGDGDSETSWACLALEDCVGDSFTGYSNDECIGTTICMDCASRNATHPK